MVSLLLDGVVALRGVVVVMPAVDSVSYNVMASGSLFLPLECQLYLYILYIYLSGNLSWV